MAEPNANEVNENEAFDKEAAQRAGVNYEEMKGRTEDENA